MNTKHFAGISALILASLLLTCFVYYPSLSGPFFLDDFHNLKPIQHAGGLTSRENLIEFVGGNESGTLGRPISMLSFAMNAQHWPADPRPFRITNLIIHLVCGLLIFLFCQLLFRVKHRHKTAYWLALSCMAIWLLHPLLVSTAAYIIQRMTQLSTLFMLCGLICYLKGRVQLDDNPKTSWSWIIGGLSFFGSFALLSKENGILLPLYALVIELTIFRPIRGPSTVNRKALILILCTPILALVFYLSLSFKGLDYRPETRNFTLGERLLTEAVVLTDYFQLIIFPQMSGLGAIHDDFPISQSLFTPQKTAYSLAILIALFSTAIGLRNKLPYLSLGILWFFAGHSLEAGPISLEPYFEHRNYLPLLGIAIAACSVWAGFPTQLKRCWPIILLTYISLSSFITWNLATTWGNTGALISLNAIEHPNSPRAQLTFINYNIQLGELETAMNAQLALAKKHPDSGSTQLGLLNLYCATGKFSEQHLRKFLAQAKKYKFDNEVPTVLRKLTNLSISNSCTGLTPDNMLSLLGAAKVMPRASAHPAYIGSLEYYRALLLKKQKRMGRAIEALEASYQTDPHIEKRLTQAAWLIELGRLDGAQYYLDLAKGHKGKRPWLNSVNLRKHKQMQNLLDRIRTVADSQNDPKP